ncbi:RagB/SusD family nutrient uptake outer membrane protein [Sphingobacterium cellulitidis]|uniref:RagB/SusD family nutrient uptake outer membrane protein n=1 Tax=Sphingobacterium cellulitidis TaxID=1768011 RepID=UPI00370D8A51
MMIKIKRNAIVYLLLSFFIICNTSCEKQLDEFSGSNAGEELQWDKISDTRSALMGSYGLLRAALFENNAHWVYGELRSGDLISYTRSDLKAMNNQELNASYPLIQDLTNWRNFYAVINSASLFIERAPEVLEKDSRYTPLNLRLDIAQARVIRAFAYFYMCRVWGDVPLITKSHDDESFIERPRTDYRSVLAYAENELLTAVKDLPYLYGVSPQSYYEQNSGAWRKVLFNKLTAYSLLAHIAAWQGNYINVDVYTQFILDHYNEIGITYLASISNLSGTAGIFSNNYGAGQLLSISSAFSNGEASASGHIEELTLANPLVSKQYPDLYVPKDSIVNIFKDPNDTRFGIDTISGLTRTNYFTNYSGETPIFSKIKIIRDGSSNGNYAIFGSNLIFTRMEEITLLRAEALTVLGNEDQAITLLNRVKTQRNVRNYSTISPTPLIIEIFNERRRELMGEGWRWYDQVRLNKILKVNPKISEMIDKGGIYWPLSDDVLSKNGLLTQNDYWK